MENLIKFISEKVLLNEIEAPGVFVEIKDPWTPDQLQDTHSVKFLKSYTGVVRTTKASDTYYLGRGWYHTSNVAHVDDVQILKESLKFEVERPDYAEEIKTLITIIKDGVEIDFEDVHYKVKGELGAILSQYPGEHMLSFGTLIIIGMNQKDLRIWAPKGLYNAVPPEVYKEHLRLEREKLRLS